MFMDKRTRFLTFSLLSLALQGCASIQETFKPMSATDLAAVRAQCGTMPPGSRIKGANLRKISYLKCKREFRNRNDETASGG